MSEAAQAKLMHWMGPLGLVINFLFAFMLIVSPEGDLFGGVIMFFPVINFTLPWLLANMVKSPLSRLHARYVTRLQVRVSCGWLAVFVGGMIFINMDGTLGDTSIYYTMSFLGIYTLFVCYVAWVGMGLVDSGEEPNLRKPLQQIRQKRKRKQATSAPSRQPAQAPPPQPPRPSAPTQRPLQHPERIFLPTDRPVPFTGPDDFKTAIQTMDLKPPFRNLRYEAMQRDPRNPKRGPFVVHIPAGSRYFLSNWFIQVVWLDSTTVTWTEDFLVHIDYKKVTFNDDFTIIGEPPRTPFPPYDSWHCELRITKIEDGGAEVTYSPNHHNQSNRIEQYVTPPKGRVRFETSTPLNSQRLLSEAMACVVSPDFNVSMRNWR